MKILFENWKSVTANYDATIRIGKDNLEMDIHDGSGFQNISCFCPDDYNIDDNGNGYILGIE